MNKDFLEELLTTCSVSGYEEELQKKVIQNMKPYAEKINTDATGNVIVSVNNDSPIKIMLSAHADEIGMIVTKIQGDGSLKVTKAGGVRAAQYLGTHVQIQTKNGIVPAVVVTNGTLVNQKDLTCEDLTIDIGASSKEEAMQKVQVGDCVCAATTYQYLMNDRMVARAFDDRIGVYIIMEALKRAKERGCNNGVYAASTTGEETTKRGAYWASQKIKPTCALVVDVTYTYDYDGVYSSSMGEAKLGLGPVLCHSSIVSKKMNDLLVECANRKNIPLQWEICAGLTHTDADKIHFSNDGVATALISIPLRYMHSSIEMLSLSDVENIIELITEFLCSYNESIELDTLKEI